MKNLYVLMVTFLFACAPDRDPSGDAQNNEPDGWTIPADACQGGLTACVYPYQGTHEVTCSDLQTDTSNCGSCGNACDGCADGVCTSCGPALLLCNGRCLPRWGQHSCGSCDLDCGNGDCVVTATDTPQTRCVGN